MRWIDTSKYTPPTEWLEKAEKLTDDLKAAKTHAERQEIIKGNSKMWKELKDDLLELSHNKCWYSEAKKDISFFDVDHFRPKSIVKKLDGELPTSNSSEGYWWLAFDWKNYRPSGEICNRKINDEYGICRGKQNYFPLVAGCTCANSPDDDINKEIPYLLDPTVQEDVQFIDFDSQGLPVPAAPNATFEYIRAKLTIKLLFLDNVLLTDQRLVVWDRCQRKLNEVANMMIERDCTSPVLEKAIKTIFKDIREMADDKEEFSSVAKACLLQSEFKWAQKIALSS